MTTTMLIHLLEQQNKSIFIQIAELITICDKPLLVNDKKFDRLDTNTNMDNLPLSIQRNEKEDVLINQLKGEISKYEAKEGEWANFSEIMKWKNKQYFLEQKLVLKLKSYPSGNIQKTEVRLETSLFVLEELLSNKKSDFPSTPKLMLFELMQVALFSGNISAVAWKILSEFKQHYKLEDYIFDDLLERAEVSNKELKKTLAIIYE